MGQKLSDRFSTLRKDNSKTITQALSAGSKDVVKEMQSDLKQVSSKNNQAMNVSLAASKDGSFVVVWQQKDGNFDHVYRSEFRLLKD